MRWHCVEKPKGYCTGEPEWEEEAKESTTGYRAGGKCKLTPDTCGKFQELAEQIDLSAPHLRQHTLKETLVSKEAANVNTESKPKKSKKNNEAQARLF